MAQNLQEELLCKHLRKLYKESYSHKDKIETYRAYYYGDFTGKQFKNIENTCNVIKQIIDTKATLALDAMMATTVVPAPASMSDFLNLKDMQDIADVLDDSLKVVMKENHLDRLQSRSMFDGLVAGAGFSEAVWNTDKKAQGDVQINIIDPAKIRVERLDIKVTDSAYIFIEDELSVYEMKKTYTLNADGSIDEDMLEKIDEIAGTTTTREAKGNPTGVVSYNSSAGGGQAFAYSTKGISTAGKQVKLWRIYLKDDSTFIEESDDTEKEKEEKQNFRMAYPNGRYIVMAASDRKSIIFEDKPIAYEFGYPISENIPDDNNTAFGRSEVEGLMFVQDRINKAYSRLRDLIAKFISTVCFDSSQIDLGEDDFVNAFATAIDNMKTNGIPQVLTNNTLSEIQSMLDYINQLKTEAKEIARVNDIMIAGSTPTQVKSGVAIEALMESPQASIRSIQRAFKDFLVDLSSKCVTLIQSYYNTPRIMALSEGRYAVLGLGEKAEGMEKPPTTVKVYNQDVVEKEVNNLQVGKYTVDIISGTEVPRSRAQQAVLFNQLVSQGMLGDINDLEMKEQYFRAIDLPNYRAILQVIRKQQENMPDNQPGTDKISVGFKDMPDWMQVQWASKNGFQIPQDLQPLLPQQQEATMQPAQPMADNLGQPMVAEGEI